MVIKSNENIIIHDKPWLLSIGMCNILEIVQALYIAYIAYL